MSCNSCNVMEWNGILSRVAQIKCNLIYLLVQRNVEFL